MLIRRRPSRWRSNSISQAATLSAWLIWSKPSARQVAQFERWHAVMEATLTVVRPGATGAELCRAAVRTETGSMPADRGFTGITDARFYINEAAIPTVILGPGSLTVAHTADEWIEIAEIRSCAEVLETFARLLAGRSLESGAE